MYLRDEMGGFSNVEVRWIFMISSEVEGGEMGGVRVSARDTASRRAQLAPFPRVVIMLY